MSKTLRSAFKISFLCVALVAGTNLVQEASALTEGDDSCARESTASRNMGATCMRMENSMSSLGCVYRSDGGNKYTHVSGPSACYELLAQLTDCRNRADFYWRKYLACLMFPGDPLDGL